MARKCTAIIFVHGQGDQSPMDDLLQLAYTIWETDPKAAAAGQLGNLLSVPVETPEDGDVRMLMTDKVNGRQFHFYQYYWAHLMEGNAVVDVWRWLIRLLQRPQSEVPATLGRARGILTLIVTCMSVAAVVLSSLTAARLASPLAAYGAIASNAYALLWGLAAVVVLYLAVQGRKRLALLVPLSACIIVTGAIFGVAITSLVAGNERILKVYPLPETQTLSENPLTRVIAGGTSILLSSGCAIDSNPDQTVFRAFCEWRAGRGEPLQEREWRPTWWHLVAAAHRFVIGICLFAATALTLVWGFASPFLKNVMADSARYFSNEPRNVDQRDKVRARGVNLLQRLHATGEYDRIVVVAHSLGTVVAYGMLDHYWGLVSRKLRTIGSAEVDEVEDAARDLNHASQEKIVACRAAYRKAQRELSRSLASSDATNTSWVVSDFITLGSPLTYAPLLIADSSGEFVAKMRKLFRLPSNPPIPVETVTDGDCTDYNFHGEWIGRATGSKGALWPSAVFAATRWTNLFFTNDGLAGGDIVGGPVAPAFGRGALDIPIDRQHLGRGFLHNEYWKWPGQTKASAWAPAGDTRAYTQPPHHIARLRQAVNLFEGDELEAQLVDPQFKT